MAPSGLLINSKILRLSFPLVFAAGLIEGKHHRLGGLTCPSKCWLFVDKYSTVSTNMNGTRLGMYTIFLVIYYPTEPHGQMLKAVLLSCVCGNGRKHVLLTVANTGSECNVKGAKRRNKHGIL